MTCVKHFHNECSRAHTVREILTRTNTRTDRQTDTHTHTHRHTDRQTPEFLHIRNVIDLEKYTQRKRGRFREATHSLWWSSPLHMLWSFGSMLVWTTSVGCTDKMTTYILLRWEVIGQYHVDSSLTNQMAEYCSLL